MFKIVWLVAYILNGVPHIDPLPSPDDPTDKDECTIRVAENAGRMADWVRGRMGVPLNFPVGVRGACVPVQIPINSKDN